ncbi:gamma-glutamyltransferase [Stratiformator vulcanicus]|uniref:Glutathione hydrolase proenzyme n=1 Tax=Stratiformator vulcanicus TaxID=2527980 RepID=A0A517QWS2_9PLAN|nr:gamma-glutamyltransferase [Stratiformator vulcanicus]QDT36081.1 Gamma-glutamyltranspeptidase precursor [Stratiformator vulcanicus]
MICNSKLQLSNLRIRFSRIKRELLIGVAATNLVAAIAVSASPVANAAEPVFGPPSSAESNLGLVVCETPIAARLGRDVLAAGGNAVDASVTTALALAVTWPEAGNIGGGGFMMIAPSNGEVVCVDYRETAPAAATVDSFANWADRRHARMAGVPGTIAGLALAHRKYGSVPWSKLIGPVADLADEGFVVDEYLADSLNKTMRLTSVRREPKFQEFRRVFAASGNQEWIAGDIMKRPDLARTLRTLAREGAEAFYVGSIADQIASSMSKSGGLITREDLASYRAKLRKPVRGDVFNFEYFGPPPPSSGGTTILLQLRMLEKCGIAETTGTSWTTQRVHLAAEAMKRSFRERAARLGDADFVEIDPEIWTEEFASNLADGIGQDQATSSEDLADGIKLTPPNRESLETTHFSIIDAEGNGVSNTYTLEGRFGCRIVVPGTGILLNNEMGDFNWNPGVTDRRGKIGTTANLIAPGKRMLSSQSPSIIKKDGKLVLLVGSPGGRTIINTVSEIIVQHLVFNNDLEDSVAAPRFHHQWFPDEIRFEQTGPSVQLFDAAAEELEGMGHSVALWKSRQGSAHCIAVDAETEAAKGVADSRRGGGVAAVD